LPSVGIAINSGQGLFVRQFRESSRPMPVKTAVIVLNYRTPAMTLDCLKSLAAETGGKDDMFVLVVDNASGDESVEAISREIRAQNWNWAAVLAHSENAGFSAGNNAGMRHAIQLHPDLRWFVLLNSDTIVRPGAIQELIAAGDRQPRVGLIGPQLEWPDGSPQTSCFRNISPLTEFLAAAATGALCRLCGRGPAPTDADPATETIEWISFACVALRRGAFERTGAMDEGFFMYFEDVDYSRRVRAAGWKIAFAPTSRVVHLRGGTSPVESLAAARRRRPKYYYAARTRYLAKFYSRHGLVLANVLWLLGRFVSWTRERLRHKAPHTCAREAIDIWTGFLSPLKSRHAKPAKSSPGESKLVIGAVVIGRNEGERLRRCLESLRRETERIVYVDSGSTDDSVALAKSLDVDVVLLDANSPFTAARARNAGFGRLNERHRDAAAVMFVDGDCEVAAGWLAEGAAAMAADDHLAVVSGRCRERFPEASIYNRLCDMEWNTLAGEGIACGGNALMRSDAFRTAGGFDGSLIAGEEPELCVRLLAAGWKIRRLDAEMVLHDAAMTRFSQWWKRAMRAGHAYAEGAALHGHTRQRLGVRESRSIWFWALVVPLAATTLAWLTRGASLLLWFAYPLMAARIAVGRRRSHNDPWKHAWCYAAACLLSKWPMLVGQCRFWLNRWRGRSSRIIEYKTPAKAAG
jgi:GT2 family glycosyltransferase